MSGGLYRSCHYLRLFPDMHMVRTHGHRLKPWSCLKVQTSGIRQCAPPICCPSLSLPALAYLLHPHCKPLLTCNGARASFCLLAQLAWLCNCRALTQTSLACSHTTTFWWPSELCPSPTREGAASQQALSRQRYRGGQNYVFTALRPPCKLMSARCVHTIIGLWTEGLSQGIVI